MCVINWIFTGSISQFFVILIIISTSTQSPTCNNVSSVHWTSTLTFQCSPVTRWSSPNGTMFRRSQGIFHWKRPPRWAIDRRQRIVSSRRCQPRRSPLVIQQKLPPSRPNSDGHSNFSGWRWVEALVGRDFNLNFIYTSLSGMFGVRTHCKLQNFFPISSLHTESSAESTLRAAQLVHKAWRAEK